MGERELLPDAEMRRLLAIARIIVSDGFHNIYLKAHCEFRPRIAALHQWQQSPSHYFEIGR